jgi:hypothetical protein
MANTFDDKQATESRQPSDGEARDGLEKPQQKVAAANVGEPAPQGTQSQVPPRPDPEGVKLIMQTLRSFVEQYAFTFAVFSLGDDLDYCLGRQPNPDKCLSVAEKLCEQGYMLVGIAGSQDFRNWTPVEIRTKDCPQPPGFASQALNVVVSLALSRQVALVD